MPGQPSGTVNWDFDLASVQATESGGIAPSIIINKPNLFTLTARLTNTGNVSGSLLGTAGRVEYHCEKLEDGTRVDLPPVSFVTGASPMLVTSPAYSTSGGPGALDVGTWMITAHVHYPGTPFAGIVAAFNQLILEVI